MNMLLTCSGETFVCFITGRTTRRSLSNAYYPRRLDGHIPRWPYTVLLPAYSWLRAPVVPYSADAGHS
jgi:hypothetical protein